MSLGETKIPVGSPPEPTGKTPARKPIPLPPESLRPPPRVRAAAASNPSPGPPVPRSGEPARRGSRWGFALGLSIPLILAALSGVWWWSTRGPAPGTADPGFEVRARIDRPAALPPAEVGNPTSGEARAPGAGEPEETRLSGAPIPDPLAIQVASFRTRGKAASILREVESLTGLRGTVLETRVDGVRWHRILLGSFGTVGEAETAGAPLLKSRIVSGILVVPVPEAAREALLGEEAAS